MSRNATKRHGDLAIFASHFRDRVDLSKNKKKLPLVVRLKSTRRWRPRCARDFFATQVPVVPRSKTPTGGVHPWVFLLLPSFLWRPTGGGNEGRGKRSGVRKRVPMNYERAARGCSMMRVIWGPTHHCATHRMIISTMHIESAWRGDSEHASR